MSTQAETDVLAGLDFDFEVPCEGPACARGKVGCSLTARWVMRLACGAAPVVCDAYRAWYLAGAPNSDPSPTWRCSFCGAAFAKSVDGHTSFAPIKVS